MPGITLSSVIMSTDAVLLPMWSASLVCMWRMRQGPTLWKGVWLGLALGTAMLAKYAALYLLAGGLLCAILDPPTRRALFSPAGSLALATAIMVLGPNLAWNAAHDFETVSHTADNASLSAFNPDLGNGAKFLLDQMAVFGPMTFIALIAGAVSIRSTASADIRSREVWLLCFIIPPLLVIAIQAIAVRAHANWAATAYPAACVLLASWISKRGWGGWLKTSISVNVLIGALVSIIALAPSIADNLGASGGFKRVRGWRETALQLETLAAQQRTTAIMFDEREVWHGVDYYGRTLSLPPLRSWRRLTEARSHAEQAGTMRPGEDEDVLIASYREDFIPRIRADFASMTPAGELKVSLGGDEVRTLHLFRASGYAPLPRTPEYEARFVTLSGE
jgi:4-amino-4-deoxy-L-arabinose transferase-like glycosyltransferase